MAVIYYLATPFTSYAKGHEAAFQEAARICGRLIARGMFVYSPIVHCHPASVYGECELGPAGWLDFDVAMMDRCEHLLVAHMDGWDQSIGVDFEIKYFEQKEWGHIYDLDPVSLEMRDRGCKRLSNG